MMWIEGFLKEFLTFYHCGIWRIVRILPMRKYAVYEYSAIL